MLGNGRFVTNPETKLKAGTSVPPSRGDVRKFWRDQENPYYPCALKTVNEEMIMSGAWQ